MLTCPSCGQENAAGAGSAALAAPSSRSPERLDPESVRRVMARYFDTARERLERHGGTERLSVLLAAPSFEA